MFWRSTLSEEIKKNTTLRFPSNLPLMPLTVVRREGKRKFQFSENNFVTLFLAR